VYGQINLFYSLEQVREQYQAGHITPQALTVQYDSLLIPYLYTPGIEPFLDTYREAAYAHPGQAVEQCNYHSLAAFNALDKQQIDVAVYHNDQAFKLAQDHHMVKNVIRSYRFIITLYLDNHNYEKALLKYHEIAPVCQYIVRHADYAAEPRLINQISLLYTAVAAYFQQTGDAHGLNTCIAQLGYMLRKAGSPAGGMGAYWYNLSYQYENARFYHHLLAGDTTSQLQALHAMRELTTRPGFPQPQQEYYSTAADIQLGSLYAGINPDSCNKYLTAYRAHPAGQQSLEHDIVYYESLAAMQNAQGHDHEAYAALSKAKLLTDSLRRSTVSSLNKNLFAQTELVHSRRHLEAARRETTRMATFTWVMALAFLSFILAVLVVFYRMRYSQNKKYTEARVSLARNVHDQIGPMLFYSKMLVVSAMQKKSTGKVDLKELEEQLTSTLNTVRDLSRELKQDKDYFSRDLVKETKELLRKTKRVTGVDYRIDCNENSLPLSFEKYTQLLRVMQELVNNSVKHADSSHINVKVSKNERKLELDYCDDGKGFPAGHLEKDGQGLSNIKARVAQIKGRIHINNQYPQGYDIKIVVPL
jgi:signal transduction histidine kinase